MDSTNMMLMQGIHLSWRILTESDELQLIHLTRSNIQESFALVMDGLSRHIKYEVTGVCYL